MLHLVLIALLVLMVGAGCRGGQVAELRAAVGDVEKVEQLFPLIAELGVDAYWVDDDCRYFHYPRGSFSNDTSVNGGCRVWDHPDPRPYDDQADRDIDRLVLAIEDLGFPIEYFHIEHEADQFAIGPGSFFTFDYCNSLVFEPSYPPIRLESEDPETVIGPLTEDWYEVACT